jgi:hypothetical protein
VAQYEGLCKKRIAAEIGGDAFAELTDDQVQERIVQLPLGDRTMAAMLVKRDSNQLAQSLSPLMGNVFANFVFGFGVVGMAVSSIIILMLINGFVVCEIMNRPLHGWTYRVGSLMPLVGVLGPFIWGAAKARFWLAVPTSVFGMVLLPIAYFTFYLMMNSKSLLGDNRPRGGKRIAWNILMAIAAGLAAFGSIYSVWSKTGWIGIGILGAFIALAVVVQIARSAKKA